MLDEAELKENVILRKFGIDLIGDVPWGTHLCQFYESKQDLTDILIPYFVEGLRNNEFCMWVTSPPLEVDEAKKALVKALPEVDEYLRKGQLEVVSYRDWYLQGGKFDCNRVLQGWVEKEKNALKSGLDGLRLTGNTFWIERSLWQSFVDYEEAVNSVIGEHKMFALCTYCLTNCSGTDVLDVVRNHVGTLVKQGDKWVLVENVVHRRKAEEAARKSEEEYSSLFANMMDGFAYCQMIFDKKSKPIDFVYLQINDAFERITGLKRDVVIGRKVTEAIPGIIEGNPELFEIYGRVATSCQKEKFEIFFKPLSMWLSISVYCPRKGYFAAVFEDITERKKVEEALHESEVKFRTVADFTYDWEYWIAPNGKMIYVSPSCKRVTGYDADEFIKDSQLLTKIVFSEDKSIVGSHFDLVSSDELHEVDFRIVTHDGETRWISHSCKAVFDDNGKWMGRRASNRDITERKNADEALWKAKNDWERTFDSVPDFVAILDNQYRIVRANRAMAQQLGVTPEKAIGLFCYQCVHGLDNPPDFCPHARTVKDVKEHTAEVHEPRLGGDFLVSTTPLKDEKGNMVGSVYVARDITKRRKTEEALMENQDRLKRSQEIANLGSWELDLTTDKLTWSDQVYRIFGLKPQEFGATYEAFLSYVHPNDRAVVDRAYSGSLADGRDSYEVEHRVVRKDNGEIRVVHEKCVHIRDPSGRIIRSIGMVHDITEQKHLEQQVEKYTKHLENLVDERTRQLKDAERLAAIGATAGMVGHDIRNPLQAITSDVYLLKSELDSLPQGEEKNLVKESLDGIEKNIDYINKIVADLQDFARPLNPHSEEADLKFIIEDLLKKNDLPKNVNVSVNVETEARKIMADSSYINRIMTNLVNNAVQAMPNGGKLMIHAFREANDNVITVKDTGVGVPEALKNKLFTPMFTTKSKGQGFGLAVIKRMTEALGGTVTFESEEGKGTIFIVRLPPSSKQKR